MRIEKLRQYMIEQDLDGFFIYSKENRQYFTKFTGSNGFVLITHDKNLLMTDSRYTEQATMQAAHFEVITYNLSPFEPLKEMIGSQGVKRVGYESKLLDDYTIRGLGDILSDVAWVPTVDVGIKIRRVKEDSEIEAINEAIGIADRALSNLIPQLKVSMTEKDVVTELEYQMRKEGSEAPAFDTIVATGTRGAMPHAMPTDAKIQSGDMVVMDFGAQYQGYMSDITRTLWFGEPCKRMQEIFQIVEKSQKTAIQSIALGKTCKAIDQAHRDVFLEYDVEQYSLRGLGHGVGLNIHEWPRVVMKNDELIDNNMIFTVEPGIYIPNVGGVRTEDIVVVRQGCAEVLTQSPHKIVIE